VVLNEIVLGGWANPIAHNEDVQASSHLSFQSESLDLTHQEDRDEAINRLKRLGRRYFKELGEFTEHLSVFCDPELAKQFVNEQYNLGRIQQRPDDFWEIV
jgi:hypothetical protein